MNRSREAGASRLAVSGDRGEPGRKALMKREQFRTDTCRYIIAAIGMRRPVFTPSFSRITLRGNSHDDHEAAHSFAA